MNAFDVRLAWWHMRGQARRFWLVIFCVGLGVAARVSIGSFMGRLDRALSREARNLLTADIEISKRTPFTAEEEDRIKKALPPPVRLQQVLSFATMGAAPASGATRLLEVRAVGESYPFYGRLQLSDQPVQEGNSSLAKLFADPLSVYVEPELLLQMHARVGDVLRLGKADFRIAGTLLQEPGLGASVFSLGPRVLIGRNQLARTGLISLGSRVYYSWLAALPDSSEAESVAADLRRAWGIPDDKSPYPAATGQEPNIQVKTFKDKQAQLRRFFDRLGDYLRLVSLMALLLGGIGVGSVVRGFVVDNLESIAVLKALGFSSGRIIRVYSLQVLGLSVTGSLVGAVLGTLAQNLFPLLLSQFMPVSVKPGLDLVSILWGLGLGVFTSAYYGLLPLLEIGNVKPLSIFRGDVTTDMRKIALWIFVLVGAALFGLVAAFEARSIVLGSLFGVAVLLGGVIIYGGGRLIIPRLRHFRRLFRGFGYRHGVSNLSRPGLRPYSAIVALGLASLLIGLLVVYQYCLLRELRPGKREELPNFFLIDIQDDQVADLRAFLAKEGVSRTVFSPMVKARYRGLNGRTVVLRRAHTREGETERRMRTREQNLSYRPALSSDETILRGRWMDTKSQGPAEASLEGWFAQQIGARVGDTVNFDIQGVPVEARVTSIRKVRWSSFQPNFFILLTPSALEDAPKTWVASLSGLSEQDRSRIQTDLVRSFPNVTIFDVDQASRRIMDIIERISWAIHFLALFSLGAGLVVLVGIALSTARQRQMETTLLKVLGATRRTIVSSVAVEFGLLGAVSSVIGLALSLAFGWILTERFLDIAFHAPWRHLAVIAVLLSGLCALTGILACRRVFEAKPLEVLREV